MSINELVPPATPSAGLRAQIVHLLPRHANFRARIQIHQVSNVPFVSGEFGVRWKFKRVQSSSSIKKGLLGRVKGKAKVNDKGKGREFDAELLTPTTTGNVLPITPILAHPTSAVAVELPLSRLATDRSISLGSVENSSHTSSHIPSSNSTLTASSQPTLHWADSSNSHPVDSATANPSRVTMIPDSTSTDDPLAVPISSTLRRGMTPFLKLKDHSVIWSHTLDTFLKFDISRETHQIQPLPLKLVVMQRVIPDDPDGSPQNPRLGAVYLNLSEYIGKGSVERKYLLKESKTNSILKLTIELEYVNGEATYIAPPLPKGEILNEIAGFLDNGGVCKKPRALNLYGPYRDQEELEKDLLGTARSGRLPKSARSQRKIDHKLSDGTTTSLESDSEEEPYDMDDDLDDVEVAFDIRRLPLAYGTKTTETIIEALFNPIKITDMKYETPFTIYDPTATPSLTKKGIDGIGLGLSGVVLEHNASTSKRQNSDGASFYHFSTGSSTSLHTTNTTTTSSSKGKSSSGGGRSKSGSRTRSIPEPYVGESVEHTTATATTTTSEGLKGWWRRHAAHNSPRTIRGPP